MPPLPPQLPLRAGAAGGDLEWGVEGSGQCEKCGTDSGTVAAHVLHTLLTRSGNALWRPQQPQPGGGMTGVGAPSVAAAGVSAAVWAEHLAAAATALAAAVTHASSSERGVVSQGPQGGRQRAVAKLVLAAIRDPVLGAVLWRRLDADDVAALAQSEISRFRLAADGSAPTIAAVAADGAGGARTAAATVGVLRGTWNLQGSIFR